MTPLPLPGTRGPSPNLRPTATPQGTRMTRDRRGPGLRLEPLEDRLQPAGSVIPAGEFDWTRYGPTGELGQLVWQGQDLVYRSRTAGAWHQAAVATAPTFTQAQYDSRDEVAKATQTAQLVFTADGTPHALFLDPVWNGPASAYQTVIKHYARTGGAWQQVEAVTAPWLSTWGPAHLVAAAGPGNSLHLVFAEAYRAATGPGQPGTGILWHATNKTGAWAFDRVADVADPRTDVWFTGGRWAPRYVSLAVDKGGVAHLTYTPQFSVSGAFGTVRSELRYATDVGGSWRTETVMAPADGTADAGLGASVAVGPNGRVAVASYYVDRYTTGSPKSSKLMYHTRTASGAWTHTDVVTRPDGYAAGDGARFTGFAPQLFYDAAGQPTIVFSDEAGEHLPESHANEFAGQIRVATLANGRWTTRTVFRQTDPIRHQLFYPVAASYKGQLTFVGLRATTTVDGNKNPVRTDFALVEVGAPAGPSAPAAGGSAAPSAQGDPTPGRVAVNAPGPGRMADGTPGPPEPAAVAATAARPGAATSVTVYRSDGAVDFTFTPFGDGYTGGARVARGDVTGDGVADIIVGSGGGIPARVRVWDGQTRAVIFDAAPFEGFTGSAEVAAGDLDGDGLAEVVVGPGAGGGPRIQVWTAADGPFRKLANDFFGLPYPDFRGGLRLAVGDINRDGYADLIVAPGEGGGPRLTVYDGRSVAGGSPRTLFNDFFVFDPSSRTGLFLAAGDFDGDGYADVVAGSGAGGGPRVRVVSGAALSAGAGVKSIADFFAADVSERAGARVAVTDANGDGRADLVTGTAGGRVTVYAGAGPTALMGFPAFAGLAGGVYVG